MTSPLASQPSYLLVLGWHGEERRLVVGRVFDVGASASADVWVPSEVLAEAGLRADGVRVKVAEHDGILHLVVAGHRRGAEWTIGPLSLSIGRLPDELLVDEPTGGLRGRSLAFLRSLWEVRRSSGSNMPVLIHGESGTGKEVVARMLHDRSPRRANNYVVVDCGAIPESLFESELFGHVKGAFSGANATRIGPFEEANGGTVLLDEVGELPLPVQPKLLRLLESGTVRRVGENTHRKVDVRVIGATHRDLRQLVQAGKFREDLYYRLMVLEVRLPPLRERHGDLRELLRSYVSEDMFAELTDEQWAAIERHPWHGNVRELRNFAEKTATHGWSELFEVRTDGTPRSDPPPAPPHRLPDLAATAEGGAPEPLPGESLESFRKRWMLEGEARYLRALLHSTHGNVTHASRVARVTRSQLHRVLRSHGYPQNGARRTNDKTRHF